MKENSWARLLAYVTGLINQELSSRTNTWLRRIGYCGRTCQPACGYPIRKGPRSLSLVNASGGRRWQVLTFSLVVSLAAIMIPVYVRAEAYLAAKRGPAAAVEFQKMLRHRGVIRNNPLGELAHLGLARAHAISGDAVKSLAQYQEFLALWKDGDSDVPILGQAKAEYARLN